MIHYLFCWSSILSVAVSNRTWVRHATNPGRFVFLRKNSSAGNNRHFNKKLKHPNVHSPRVDNAPKPLITEQVCSVGTLFALWQMCYPWHILALVYQMCPVEPWMCLCTGMLGRTLHVQLWTKLDLLSTVLPLMCLCTSNLGRTHKISLEQKLDQHPE